MTRIREWAEEVDGNPALKRKVAVWSVVSVVVFFCVVTFSLIFAFGSGESSSPPKPDRQTRAEPPKPPPSADSSTDTKLLVGVLAGVAVCVALVVLYWLWSRWLQQQRQRDTDHPIVVLYDFAGVVLSGVAFIVGLCTPPIGWILIYLWQLEKQRNQDRQEFAEALDELRERDRYR